jgi:hypothetical protein
MTTWCTRDRCRFEGVKDPLPAGDELRIHVEKFLELIASESFCPWNQAWHLTPQHWVHVSPFEVGLDREPTTA